MERGLTILNGDTIDMICGLNAFFHIALHSIHNKPESGESPLSHKYQGKTTSTHIWVYKLFYKSDNVKGRHFPEKEIMIPG